MPRQSNQKLKLLYLAEIFREKTDEDHALSLSEITALLAARGISADRKTLYQDFEDLRSFGLDILTKQEGRTVLYHLASRTFELAEVKLLVDSVQSARFISEKKSRALIKKLGTLVSDQQANTLQRQVIIAGRIKTMNESIYYHVDKLHTAINSDRQVSFHYGQWTLDKKMEARRGGQLYIVSPLCLLCEDGNYYLIAYDSSVSMIKHFRVDKMKDLSIVDSPREGIEALKATDIAAYSKRLFGMYGGQPAHVTFLCENAKVGIMLDRFGKDVILEPLDADHFTLTVEVVPSDQFLGWVVSLGSGVRIIAPDSVTEKLRALVQRLAETYRSPEQT